MEYNEINAKYCIAGCEPFWGDHQQFLSQCKTNVTYLVGAGTNLLL